MNNTINLQGKTGKLGYLTSKHCCYTYLFFIKPNVQHTYIIDRISSDKCRGAYWKKTIFLLIRIKKKNYNYTFFIADDVNPDLYKSNKFNNHGHRQDLHS